MKKLTVLLLSVLLIGCVSQSKYDLLNQELSALKTSYDAKIALLEEKVNSLESNKIQLENDITSLKEQRDLLKLKYNGRLDMMRFPTTISQGRHQVNHPMFSFTYDAQGLDDQLVVIARPFGVQLWYISESTSGDLITFYIIPESQIELYNLSSRNILQRYSNNIVLVRHVPISYEFPDTVDLGTKLHSVVNSIKVTFVR
jgi:outer membrane murein-binding lipoprotein Lpp